MKTILLSLILFSTVAFAKQEIATGYGDSFDSALQSAKMLATDQAAGSFISSKQEVTNGKFKESVANYNGGSISSFTVRNSIYKNGVYAVTIEAEVDTDKVNQSIQGDDTKISNSQMYSATKMIDNQEKALNAWTSLNSVTNQFATSIVGSEYTPIDGVVHAKYNVVIHWNPKWYNDAMKLSTTMKLPLNENTIASAICFKEVPLKSGICSLVPSLPTINYPKNLVITARFVDGTTNTITRPISRADLYRENIIEEMSEPGLFGDTYEVRAMILYSKVIGMNTLDLSIPVATFKRIVDVSITAQ